jgi:hypothetical protein
MSGLATPEFDARFSSPQADRLPMRRLATACAIKTAAPTITEIL